MNGNSRDGDRRYWPSRGQTGRRDVPADASGSPRRAGPDRTQDRPTRSSAEPRTQGRCDAVTGAQACPPGVVCPPYDFVPVVPDLAVTDTPVFHHGANRDQARLLSGEIRCTLTALTPLLVGHDQYPASKAEGHDAEGNHLVRLPKAWGIKYPVSEKKSIVEPLRLDGRVLISGSSLTGMLRHSLGSLLSAPMERVAGRTYSYRQNIGHANPGNALYECRPAIVCATEPALRVLVLPYPRAAVFLKGQKVGPDWRDDHWVWKQIGSPLAGDTANGTFPGVRLDDYHHLVPVDPASSEALNHYYFGYKGGMDGSGDMAALFSNNSRTYHHVLATAADYKASVPLEIPEDVHQRYLDTQDHLVDSTRGHLSSRHPFVKDENRVKIEKAIVGIRQGKALEIGQLIYCEVEIGAGTQQPVRVTAFGHNHHYREGYADSVRTVGNGHEPRKVLSPLACEAEVGSPPESAQPDHAPPSGLSGARGLFGYASSDAEDSGSKGIGKGDFQRLAGRLAFNIAVEHAENPQDSSRFMDEGRPVPLRVLGLPRPSAVEHYIDQEGAPEGCLNTYGDLPGEAGGELSGRKYYPHQPAAATDPSLYRLDSDLDMLDGCPEKEVFVASLPPWAEQAEWQVLSSREIAERLLNRGEGWVNEWERTLLGRAKHEKGLQSHLQVATRILHSIPIRKFLRAIEHLVGYQAGLGRYISNPGATFGCTLRFRDLRPWELGAVLLALEPSRIASIQGALPQNRDIQSLSNAARSEWNMSETRAPIFAHKLGRGRPLGLGSVRIAVDHLAIWDGQDMEDRVHAAGCTTGVVADAFSVLEGKLKPLAEDPRWTKVIDAWLRMHQYRDQPRRDYPRAQDKPSGRYEIHVYYTEQGRARAKNRRTRRSEGP